MYDVLNFIPVTAGDAAPDAGRNCHNVIIIEYSIDPQQIESSPQIAVSGQRSISRVWLFCGMGSILLCKQIADREGQAAQDIPHLVFGHGA